MTDKELLKECFDLLTSTVEILIGEKLEIVKQYAVLEDRVKKQLGQPSDKPSLFTDKGLPTAEPVKPVEVKPPVVQPAEKVYPTPPEKVITDPLAKLSPSFNEKKYPDGDPRSGVSREKLIAEADDKFPWETGTEQLGLKTPPKTPITTINRPQPEAPGEDPFANVP